MDKKNLIITIVLSALIMVGWQYFYEMPRLKHQCHWQKRCNFLYVNTRGMTGVMITIDARTSLRWSRYS